MIHGESWKNHGKIIDNRHFDQKTAKFTTTTRCDLLKSIPTDAKKRQMTAIAPIIVISRRIVYVLFK
eukprot:gene15129-4517_t